MLDPSLELTWQYTIFCSIGIYGSPLGLLTITIAITTSSTETYPPPGPMPTSIAVKAPMQAPLPKGIIRVRGDMEGTSMAEHGGGGHLHGILACVLVLFAECIRHHYLALLLDNDV